MEMIAVFIMDHIFVAFFPKHIQVNGYFLLIHSKIYLTFSLDSFAESAYHQMLHSIQSL